MLKLGGSKKKLIMIVAIVALVGGVGAGGFVLGSKGKGAKAPAKEKGVEEEIVADAAGEGKAEEGGHGEAKEGEAKEGGHGEAKEGGHGESKEGEAKEGGEKAEGGHGGGGKAGAKEAAPSKKDLIYQFDKNFTANLLDPRGRWFILASIQIEATSAKAMTNIEDNVAPLRDATITLLSSKTKDEVMTPEDKERIKRELLARYEGILEPRTIKNIYFTDFAVTPR